MVDLPGASRIKGVYDTSTSGFMNEADQSNSMATEAPPMQLEAPPAVGKYECNQCPKSFDNPSALAMHRVRMHTQAGKRGWKLAIDRSHRARNKTLKQKRESYERRKMEFRRRGLNARGEPFSHGRLQPPRRLAGPKSREELAAERREYQRKIRERNFAQGLTSKGTPRKRGYTPKIARPSRAREAMRAYQQRHYWQKRAAAGHRVPPDKQHLLMSNGARPNEKTTPTIAPTFRQALADELNCASVDAAIIQAIQKLKKMTARRRAMWCPVCGTNMQNVETSVNFTGE